MRRGFRGVSGQPALVQARVSGLRAGQRHVEEGPPPPRTRHCWHVTQDSKSIKDPVMGLDIVTWL